MLKDSKSVEPIKSFEFSKSGRLIFAIGKDTKLKIWDTLKWDGEIF